MEKQKLIQKNWYERKLYKQENKLIEISNKEHIEKLKKLIPLGEASLTLNCGCGKGEQRDIFGPSIGIDISFENIRALTRKGEKGIVADMEFLPFKDNIFDVVYGFGIIHHLNNIERGIKEASRVLKNEGYIGFSGENNGLCPLIYLMSFIYGNWKIEKGSYQIRKRNLKNIFLKSGIKNFIMIRYGIKIYGLGSSIYKITYFMEKILAKTFKFIYIISGYCCFSGKKLNNYII